MAHPHPCHHCKHMLAGWIVDQENHKTRQWPMTGTTGQGQQGGDNGYNNNDRGPGDNSKKEDDEVNHKMMKRAWHQWEDNNDRDEDRDRDRDRDNDTT